MNTITVRSDHISDTRRLGALLGAALLRCLYFFSETFASGNEIIIKEYMNKYLGMDRIIYRE